MTDYAQRHQPKPQAASARRRPPGSLFALAALVVLHRARPPASSRCVLWPRWPARRSRPTRRPCRSPSAACCSTCRRPRSACAMQRRPGAQERLDLAFLWPSLAPPDPAARPAPREAAPPIDRHLHHHRAAVDARCAPNERVKHDLSALSRRHAVRRAGRPDGDLVPRRHALSGRGPVLRSGRAAGLRDALLAPGAAGTPGMCLYERRFEGADVTVRFPSDWLTTGAR